MYFDLAPKERLEDFYNYREELRMAQEYVERERIITIIGLRRVGKSSLMRVLRNLLNLPSAWIDGRTVHSKGELKETLTQALRKLIREQNIVEKAKSHLRAVDVLGVELELSKEQVWEKIRDVDGVLFIDEAQMMAAHGIDRWLSFLYDEAPYIRIVLAGSQIGLLEDIMERPSLKGRAWKKVKMEPLSHERALSFLLEGFQQVGKEVDLQELKEAVAFLGGLIGWLTLYGHERLYVGHKEALRRVIEKAKDILWEELEHFLEGVKEKKAYLLLLEGLALGITTPSKLRDFLLSKGVRVSSAFVSKALKRLFKYSFIVKKGERYDIADPLLKHILLS